MATKKSTGANPALADPAPKADTSEANYLVSLILWIEQARHILKQIDCSADVNPELKAALERSDIRCASAPWESEESQGLCYLILHATKDLAGDAA